MSQPNLICFNKNNLFYSIVFLLLLTFIIIIVLPNPIYKINYKGKEKYSSIKNIKKSNKKINKELNKENYLNSDNNFLKINKDQIDPVNVSKVLKRDIDVVNNSLHPPERRQPMHISNQILNSFERTRGEYTTRVDNYHLIGNCIRKSDEKIVNLYGRQRYPGSSIYEYYGETKDSTGMQTKFNIPSQRNRELYNGDTIDIPNLDTSKGKFIVNIFDYELPRYNPYQY